MKHRIFSLGSAVSAFLFAFAATCAPLALAADGDDAASLRSDCDMAFTKLTLNSKEALQSALKTRKKGAVVSSARGASASADSAKFKIASVADPTVEENDDAQKEAQMAVKVWFTLVDGTKVNPLKHEWSAKEKFYVHVQAAAPVYVSLFHEIPAEKGKAADSIQVYPNKRYPNSGKAIQAGAATRLPVQFELEDNDEAEIMSLVVVRADWEGIQDDLTENAVASVSNKNGRPVVDAEFDDDAGGTLKCLNVRASSKTDLDVKRVKSLVRDATDKEATDKEAKKLADNVNELGSIKFHISESNIAESDNADEVCIYLFASQKVGQCRLTIKK